MELINNIKYLYCCATTHDIPEENEDVVFELKYGAYTWGQCMRYKHWIRLWRESDCKEDEYYEEI